MHQSPELWTIGASYERLCSIYSDANALTTPLDERFAFLMMSAGDLARCFRKQRVDLYPIAIAQLFAWFMSLGDELFRSPGGVILCHAMGEKYPKDRCGYCGKFPCECKEEIRKEHQPVDCSSEQLGWTLSQWQSRLADLYGPANREGGVPRAINRLFEEISEVGLVLHLADGFNESLVEVRRRIAREMTDVLAWVFAIATLLNIDLELSVREVYGHGCPVCKARVCTCRHVEHRPSGLPTHRFMSAEDIHLLLRAA